MSSSDGEPYAPPQNLDAEREMLGAVLAYYSPRIVAEIKATGLTPEDFYYAHHGQVFAAIVRLDAAGEFVDFRTVARVLGAESSEALARLEYLACFAVPHGVCERARMIFEDARWRDRLGAAYEVIDACHSRDAEAYESAVGLFHASIGPVASSGPHRALAVA